MFEPRRNNGRYRALLARLKLRAAWNAISVVAGVLAVAAIASLATAVRAALLEPVRALRDE
ncbi:MAG: hypothetical protein HY820_41940 [Acidobacteria bacterium]|nr:hypothetical protein [Acidobacteriota bacterium]